MEHERTEEQEALSDSLRHHNHHKKAHGSSDHDWFAWHFVGVGRDLRAFGGVVELWSGPWYMSRMIGVRGDQRPTEVRAKRGVCVADETLRQALDDVRARCDIAVRRAADPVHFVHRYEGREDQEIVALIASSLAFGNVKALCAKIEDCLNRLGSHIAANADHADDVHNRLSGFRHRLYTGHDVARLVVGARRMQHAYGSLGASLVRELETGRRLRDALGLWVVELRERGGFSPFGTEKQHGADHLLPNPANGSAIKRLMLFLRWMARPADGVDLGFWPIPPSNLVIPLDTHIHKLSRNIGLTMRNAADYRAAEEITAALARLDPDDPTKYDFSLCHLGMLQSCPSRKDVARCEGCGVKPVCRHWHVRPGRVSTT